MTLNTLPTSVNQARELIKNEMDKGERGVVSDLLAAVDWFDAPEKERKAAERLIRKAAKDL